MLSTRASASQCTSERDRASSQESTFRFRESRGIMLRGVRGGQREEGERASLRSSGGRRMNRGRERRTCWTRKGGNTSRCERREGRHAQGNRGGERGGRGEEERVRRSVRSIFGAVAIADAAARRQRRARHRSGPAHDVEREVVLYRSSSHSSSPPPPPPFLPGRRADSPDNRRRSSSSISPGAAGSSSASRPSRLKPPAAW